MLRCLGLDSCSSVYGANDARASEGGASSFLTQGCIPKALAYALCAGCLASHQKMKGQMLTLTGSVTP